MQTQPEASRDYARRLYDRIIAWSENADRKAQLILTLDGVFVSFTVGSILSKPADVRAVTTEFGSETWVLLGFMTLALVASIGFALRSLVSWLFRSTQLRDEARRLETTPQQWLLRRKQLREEGRHPDTQREHMGSQTPDVIWYFQVLATVNEEEFISSVAGVDAAIEAKALARNAIRVAGHVVKKHKWVNWGFLCAGLSLVLFLGAGISYVLRVA